MKRLEGLCQSLKFLKIYAIWQRESWANYLFEVKNYDRLNLFKISINKRCWIWKESLLRQTIPSVNKGYFLLLDPLNFRRNELSITYPSRQIGFCQNYLKHRVLKEGQMTSSKKFEKYFFFRFIPNLSDEFYIIQSGETPTTFFNQKL